MNKKPTREELMQRIEALEREADQHKQSAETLLEIEREKYIKLINDSNDAIIIAQGIELKLANKAAYRMWGYRNEQETAGLTMIDAISPQDIEIMLKRAEDREIGKNVPTRYEFRALRKDGTEFLAELSVSRIIYQGQVARQGVIRDISEIKKAEEKLQKSEEKYRRLTENAKDMIYRQSLPDGKYEYVSPASIEITGYTPEEICSEALHIRKAVHPAWKDYLEKQWEKLLKGEIPQFYEFQIVHKSGDVKWIHQRNIIIYDDNGKPAATEGIATDITEKKNMEMTILTNAKWYEDFLEKLNDMVFTTDNSGNIQYVNNIAESITGRPRKDIIGKHFLKFCNKKSQDVAVDIHQRALKGESCKHFITLNNGKILHFKNDPFRNKEGKIVGVFGVARDVTELKLAEEELRKTNAKLEEKVKERTREIDDRNTTLKVLLKQREGDKEKLEKAVISNVKELVLPNLERLKSTALNSKQQTALNILESNLNEIISPFAKGVSSNYMRLTPTEIQIANFIKHGSSSKEISNSLGLSQRTVDTHRYNIRKKLGVSGTGANLRTYLLSLS